MVHSVLWWRWRWGLIPFELYMISRMLCREYVSRSLHQVEMCNENFKIPIKATLNKALYKKAVFQLD